VALGDIDGANDIGAHFIAFISSLTRKTCGCLCMSMLPDYSSSVSLCLGCVTAHGVALSVPKEIPRLPN
jgi:hypothetical protein